MRAAKYYSTKPAGSYFTSIIVMDENYECVFTKVLDDESLRAYCECLDDMKVEHVSYSRLSEIVASKNVFYMKKK